MKKTFLTCMAVVALLAIASGAGAITCTIDQRPAATLLIPYFQASYTTLPDGSFVPIASGPTALDTLVTIGNASSSPMIAHLSVFSERSELVLDFNIALTGFDIQSFSVAQVLRGFLPVTPVNLSHVSEVKDTNQVTIGTNPPGNGDGDVCQRNTNAPVFPDPGGYIRIDKAHLTAPATSFDNTFATVAYPPGPFPLSLQQQILDSLDVTKDSNECTGVSPNPVDGLITNPVHGYITIDHANYCNLSNPRDNFYWTNDAAGMENNLWGDYIFTSGAGIGTMGFPAVAIEADPSLADNTTYVDGTLKPLSPIHPGRRTFYRRYVTVADTFLCNPGNDFHLTGLVPPRDNSFDCGFGDQREPLGLKYAARWFDKAPFVSSNFNVWRASSVPSQQNTTGLQDLLGPYSGTPVVAKCTNTETTVLMNFYDEDENTVTGGGCTVSPCGVGPNFQFPLPLETQRVNITGFTHPNWPAGWVSMEFFNSSSALDGLLDQAYVTYDIQGSSQFLSAGIPAAQLDSTNCQPLLVTCTTTQPTLGTPPSPPALPLGGPGGPCYGPTAATGVTTTAPAIPQLVGSGPP